VGTLDKLDELTNLKKASQPADGWLASESSFLDFRCRILTGIAGRCLFNSERRRAAEVKDSHSLFSIELRLV
jgi:hypothetical protein